MIYNSKFHEEYNALPKKTDIYTENTLFFILKSNKNTKKSLTLYPSS